MGKKRTRVVWSGKLVFSSSGEAMNVSLISFQGSEPFSFITVHKNCWRAVKKQKKPSELWKGLDEELIKRICQETSLFCPTCRKYVGPKESTKALRWKGKIASLTEDEIGAVDELAKSECAIQFVGNDDAWNMVQFLSSGRRYYVSPRKFLDAQLYIKVILTLVGRRWMGFIPAITIGDKTFRAVLKPLFVPRRLAGKAGFGRDVVLIVELLNPLETVRLPREIFRLKSLDSVPRRINPENGFKKERIPSGFFHGWLFSKIKEKIGKS